MQVVFNGYTRVCPSVREIFHLHVDKPWYNYYGTEFFSFFSCPLGSWISLWNFETTRGSLIRPKWPKLASLAQNICTL